MPPESCKGYQECLDTTRRLYCRYPQEAVGDTRRIEMPPGVCRGSQEAVGATRRLEMPPEGSRITRRL